MKKIIDQLASLKFFFIISGLLLAAFIIGGVIPQGQSPEDYKAMLGSFGTLLVMNLRLDNVFSSPWFLLLLAAGALNMLACTVKQWKVLRHRPGVFLSHLGVFLMFVGGAVSGLFATHGVLPLETGLPRGDFFLRSGGMAEMPFRVLLKEFNIRYWDDEKHIIHVLKTIGAPGMEQEGVVESVEVKPGQDVRFKSGAPALSVLNFYPDFSIGENGPMSVGDARNNPALTVKPAGDKAARMSYLFAAHPDFHGMADTGGYRFVYEYRPGQIKQFESRIAIVEDGQEKLEKVINVNTPLTYRGYRFYQSGYDENNLNSSTLQVSRDPSVLVIYAGFLILMAGLTWAFWKEMAAK
ncbi:MAG: cytochrome c biogenesis protein ResB [Elusimicrobia bacterium]|nr:cytochrome c biogenesis protein ResB [Elusimicrobiota bacterium]